MGGGGRSGLRLGWTGVVVVMLHGGKQCYKGGCSVVCGVRVPFERAVGWLTGG